MSSGKQRVFISRKLSANSDFRMILEAEGWAIEAWSYLQFEALAFEFEKQPDWLFFYSPRGVQYFFEQEAPDTIQSKLGVMGKGTAKALEKVGLIADFIGNGQPEEVAQHFADLLKQGDEIDFAQAKRSQNSVAQFLPEGIIKNKRIVYHNFPRTAPPLPLANILVFTSPMNVEAYWNQTNNTPSDESQKKYLAIGPTTQKAIQSMLGKRVPYPKTPTERELAQLVLNQIR